jgi:hypothetical protein
LKQLSVIVPTITGREETLARTVEAYHRTLEGAPYQIVVVHGETTWPGACNEGYRRSTGDIVHFTADDIEPVEGWWQEAIPWLEEHDELPAPRVFNHAANGPQDNSGDGPDKALTAFTRVPILSRDQYERIGPWPEYQYVADVWLSEKARTLGIQTRMIHSYTFVHHWSQIGRCDDDATLGQAAVVLSKLRAGMAV